MLIEYCDVKAKLTAAQSISSLSIEMKAFAKSTAQASGLADMLSKRYTSEEQL